MAGERSNSVDSGLQSSDVLVRNKDETQLKGVFSQSNNNPDMSRNVQQEVYRSNTMPSKQRPRSAEHASHRRSFHEAHQSGIGPPKEDSDSDRGIVPDMTKLLLGNRRRVKGGSPSTPTYSIHINTLYVYQNPTVENPMYQQLPVDRHEETPPSPCPKPQGYQYVWPSNNPSETKQPQQHFDSTFVGRSRPTSLNLRSRDERPSRHDTGMFAPQQKEDTYGRSKEVEEDIKHISISSPTLAEGEEMEILIRGKGGKSRRYKLQPIVEQPLDHDAYVMNTSEGGKVVIEGFTINDPDEAFSETGSIDVFPESSSLSTATSCTLSGAAIDTTVGDCKITVNQTFANEDFEENDRNQPVTRMSLSTNDITADPPKTHPYHAESSPMINELPFSQAKAMNDPTYFDFGIKSKLETGATPHRLPDTRSKSFPNLAISARIDTCYECRHQRRSRFFSPKQKLPRSCTLEGFHQITDEHEISFMKDILDKNGKLGNWFITPTTNQPGYSSCLYVKTKREVTSFPVALNKKRKYFVDFNLKKSFSCLCKLTEFYKFNHLPSVSINLGQPLPKDVFPDMSFGADGSGTLKEQYVGIHL